MPPTSATLVDPRLVSPRPPFPASVSRTCADGCVLVLPLQKQAPGEAFGNTPAQPMYDVIANGGQPIYDEMA